MSLEKIKDEALKLAPKARAELARDLLASLEDLSEAELEELWVEEAMRRKAEVESGAVVLRTADEVLREVRDRGDLSKFDLKKPGNLISGDDRNRAYETVLILSLIESEFMHAIASFGMFKPITEETVEKELQQWGKHQESKYERCLNQIFARSFVISLDLITKMLRILKDNYSPPDSVNHHISEWENIFGNSKHIRDSFAHLEDRGRGKDKKGRCLNANLIVLGH